MIPETNSTVEARAAKLVAEASAELVASHPMWGAVFMKLRVRADARCKTMYTDAKVLGYNAAFIITKPLGGVVWRLAHETLHCVLGHPQRARDKDLQDWNEACDHACNLIMRRDPRLAKHEPSTISYCDPQYEGMTADMIYKLIRAARMTPPPQQAQQQQQKQDSGDQQQAGGDAQGEGEGDGAGEGDAEGEQGEQGERSDGKEGEAQDGDADASEGDADAAADAQDDAGDAQDEGAGEDASEGAGDASDDLGDPGSDEGDIITPGSAAMPGDEERGAFDPPQETGQASAGSNDQASDAALEREWLDALTAAAFAGSESIDEELERAMRLQSSPRQSFKEELERFLTQQVHAYEDWSHRNRRFADYYMPSRGGVGATRFIFAVDISASITDAVVAQFRDVINIVWAESSLQGATVVYCDTQVRRVEEYDSMPEFDAPAPQGGGTYFAPVFEFAQDRIAGGEEVAGIIYLTDQENFDHAALAALGVETPTLWVNPGRPLPAPFGDACSMLD
jgi:predicted metal-dependent peptidase